jgi:hypothetical protein
VIGMPNNLRLKWQGKIYNSAIELAGKVIQCKKENKQERARKVIISFMGNETPDCFKDR